MAKGPHKKKRVGPMARRLNRRLATERAEAEQQVATILDAVASALDGKTVSLTGRTRKEKLRIIRGGK